MDFFSTASGGVISSVATVKTDITARAAPLIVDDIAEEIDAETRRSASLF